MGNETSFGAPPDPVYVRFRDGLIKADNDFIDQYRWRWSPRHGGWYTYSVQDWILDDVGLPDTPPGMGLESFLYTSDASERATADWRLPDVYAAIGTGYNRYKGRYANLVWTWRNGGDRRVAISRSPSTPTTDTTPPGGVVLNAECTKRVADIREWVRRGVITAVDGQRLIRDIVAECT